MVSYVSRNFSWTLLAIHASKLVEQEEINILRTIAMDICIWGFDAQISLFKPLIEGKTELKSYVLSQLSVSYSFI